FATGTSLTVPSFEVTELLDGRDHFDTGGIRWKLEHIPGHSLDSVVFISEEHRQIFGGAVLFQGSIGRAGFPGGDMNLLIEGVQSKLMGLPDDFVVYPGHGPSTTIGQERKHNPYLLE